MTGLFVGCLSVSRESPFQSNDSFLKTFTCTVLVEVEGSDNVYNIELLSSKLARESTSPFYSYLESLIDNTANLLMTSSCSVTQSDRLR